MSDEHVPENRTDEERKIFSLLNTGMLGASILLLAGMLAIPKQDFDRDLTYASIAFAIAGPLLVFASVGASVSDIRLDWRLETISFLGEIAFLGGIYFIFDHLNPLAGDIIIVAAIITPVIYWIITRKRRKKR